MADDSGLQGMDDCLRKLQEIGSEDGKFLRQSLRTALREAAKLLQRTILAVVGRESGLTLQNVKVRAGPRSRRGPSMLVGVFGGAVKGLTQTFYAGFAAFGHKTPSGGKVQGTEWPDAPRSDMPLAEQKITEVLRDEITQLAGGR